MIACGGTTSNNEKTVTITISPTLASVTAAQYQQFQAAINGATNTNITWAVDGNAGGNASIGTISSTGLYVAPPLPAITQSLSPALLILLRVRMHR